MTDRSSHRTALLAGASGLVGGHLLQRLLADPRYKRVVTVSRKALGIEHPKLRSLITDFDAIEAAMAGLGETVDDAFCALGTTIKTAGSRAAFRRVDFGYVVAFARAARAVGARRFMLVSAIGASARSRIFYLRVKGETEEAVAALGYPALHIFRPGLLLGQRAESRPREALGMAGTPIPMPTWWHPRAAELLKPEIALSTLAARYPPRLAELIEATKSKACVSR